MRQMLLAVARYRQRGFTLIELLVVVAIIAILAALLLPALRSARDSGYTAMCANNLHQLGLGGTLYLDDYGGRLPQFGIQGVYDSVPGTPGVYSYWPGHFRHYIGTALPSIESLPLANQTLYPIPIHYEIRCDPKTANFVNRISTIRDNPFFCPSTRGHSTGYTIDKNVIGGNSCGNTGHDSTDYGLNEALTGVNTPPVMYATSVRNPSLIILLADAYFDLRIGNGKGSGTFAHEFSPRHRAMTAANVVCIDGHSETLKWDVTLGAGDINYGSTPSVAPGFRAYTQPD